MTYKLRFIMVKRGCPYCSRAINAVNLVNLHLEGLDRIRIIDNFEWEEFSFKSNPIISRLDPESFEGYPYIFIDGVEIVATYTELLIISIARQVEDDLLSPIEVGNISIP